MSTIYTDATFTIYYDTQDPENEGWAWRFKGEGEGTGLVTESGEINNTRDLLYVLETYAPAGYDCSDLPTWGEAPAIAASEYGVFSWDETHLIVGCPDLQRVPRHDDSTGGEQ